jgi:hypothetical protein
MKWQTAVIIPKSNFEINHDHKIISIGSCFSEHIGNIFHQYKFNIFLNPSGQLYNPFSIAKSIEIALNAKKYEESDLFFHTGLWHSFDHHSDYSHQQSEIVLQNVNSEIARLHKFINEADYLFITFGTAFYFHHISSNKHVANCHKVAAKEFERKLLNPETIIEVYNDLLGKLRLLNPKLHVVFTVSPVRYLSFGNLENSTSKGALFVALDAIFKSNSNASYFPSYEIIMDELRDYRFYSEDMIHPSHSSILHVWQRISEAFFNKETHDLLNKIEQINKALNHKPFNPESQEHLKFREQVGLKIADFKAKYPLLNFDSEIEMLRV